MYVGAHLPGEIDGLKYPARLLLASAGVLQGRRLLLRRLRAQQEIDEGFYWDSHSSHSLDTLSPRSWSLDSMIIETQWFAGE